VSPSTPVSSDVDATRIVQQMGSRFNKAIVPECCNRPRTAHDRSTTLASCSKRDGRRKRRMLETGAPENKSTPCVVN